MTKRDQEWLAMMLERLRQHAFSAGVAHGYGDIPWEDSESDKAKQTRQEILQEYA